MRAQAAKRARPVTEAQRIAVVEALGRETMGFRSLWLRMADAYTSPDVARFVQSAVSHGLVAQGSVTLVQGGHMRVYSVRPAGIAWLPRVPEVAPTSLTVNLQIAPGMDAQAIRALVHDQIGRSLAARGWA